jgi:hypothetical protein
MVPLQTHGRHSWHIAPANTAGSPLIWQTWASYPAEGVVVSGWLSPQPGAIGGDRQLRNDFLGGQTDRLGERGERWVQVGDLLDAHIPGHAGRDHLDHFGRVLTD